MNDLHSRLSALADDLAPDADPYDQVAGARTLHRRQRRTRAGIAGAALAVALVAVGVPTVVGTLSAPRDGEVAGPSVSEPLRGPADAVRMGMAWWEEDGSVPDPEAGTPCPDAAAVLSGMDSRYAFEPTGIDAGGSTLSGCGWSTDPSAGTAAADRIDLMLRAAPDLDADLLVSNLEIDRVQDGCPSATIFPGLVPNVLQVCDRGEQRVWTVTVVDEDGTGAWQLTAAVGTDVDAGFRLGAASVANLWGIVSGFAPEPTGEDEPDPLSTMAESLRADLAARAPVSVPEPALDVACPEAAARLGEATGMFALAPHPANADSRTSEGCRWSLATGQTSAADGLDLELRSDPALTQDELQRQYNAERNRGGCYPSAMPGSVGFSALLVCSGEAGTSWTLTLLADGGTGGWVLTADVGADLPEAFGTGKASMLALRDVVTDL